jgi:hypothetical protein
MSMRTLRIPAFLLVFAVAVFAGTARDADAANVQFSGTVGYSYVGTTAVLTADKVQNLDAGGISGTLHMELWALSTPYTGTAVTGYKMAQYSLGQLSGGFFFANINSGNIAFTPPPNGVWYFVMILTEFIGSGPNNGYATRDYANFQTPVVIGGATVTPQSGNWNNPNEDGTGYSLDFKHGVLIVVFYSFTPSGSPQWYVASGPVIGNTFNGTLDKFVNGQCIFAGCTYRFPTGAGNDGAVTIVFSSNTAGTMYLPGGRVIPIQPLVF